MKIHVRPTATTVADVRTPLENASAAAQVVDLAIVLQIVAPDELEALVKHSRTARNI